MTGLPLNIDWQQIMLHLFNFVILTGGLYILLYKPVKNFMDKRLEYFAAMDDAAQKNQDKTIEMKREYEKKLESAQEEISKMKSEAAAAAQAAADRQITEAKEESDRIVRDARARAEAEHDRIMTNARAEVVELAREAARKILSEEDIYSEFVRSTEQEEQDG